MKNSYTKWRNAIIRAWYVGVLKQLFFRMDPEDVHDRMTRMGAFLGKFAFTRALVSLKLGYSNAILEQKILGIDFKNPVGLAAGFDKNAELTTILPDVGFGFEEVGSITGEPCAGNPKPRLWRLKKSKGLVVWYGLKNDGCEVISKRLETIQGGRENGGPGFRNVIGTSVAMTNCADNLDVNKAVQDYAKAFRSMVTIGHYFTINISCPNTLGGQPFIEPEKLELLLTTIDTVPTNKPVFIKLSPDLSMSQVDTLVDIAKKHRIHGIIVSNLTKKRDNPKILDADVPTVGGISGKVVEGMSDELLAHIYKREGNRFVLIGVGGIFSAEDAYRKIRLGASLVQLITGMIYEGPQLISEINRGLVELLKRDGFRNISEAIGADNK